jgi:hypothetical protein
MSKTVKIISLILVGLLLNFILLNTSVRANPESEKEKKFTEKVKQSIAKLGIGKEAKVEVKLKNGKKLKGFVSEITDEYFVVTNETNNETTQVPYPQTSRSKVIIYLPE